MHPLRNVLRLPSGERRLLLRALLAVMAIRVALWLLPFSRVRQMVARAASGGPGGPPAPGTDARIADAVERAAGYVPAASCLVRALALRVLLERADAGGELRIGVERQDGRLRAHAWVVRGDGMVLIGGDHDLTRFTVLPALPGEGP